jgi:hypothetical protein
MEANTTWTVVGITTIVATVIATQWKRLIRIKILVMTTSGAIVNIDIDRSRNHKNGGCFPLEDGPGSPPNDKPKPPP